MMIPGSQARLIVLPVGSTDLAGGVVFRFRRAHIRPRAPRIDVTNSEGLPGAVRGVQSVFGLGVGGAGGINASGVGQAHVLTGAPGATFGSFKNYPYESQLPGVGVCEVMVEQASWDFDQIIYQTPSEASPIMPQRYYAAVFRPNWFQTGARFSYSFFSLYVEEADHRFDVKQDQPVSFTAFSNGPWTYPRNTTNPAFPAANPATSPLT